MPLEQPYIVADIGGTNARFGLVSGKHIAGSRYNIMQQRHYPSDQFDNIEQATQHYLASLNGEKVSGACLAVAGPVMGDNVQLTNLNWSFSINEIQKALQLDKIEVINDFAAYALATPYVQKEHLLSLNLGDLVDNSPLAIVGPGTGFGVAALIPRYGHWTVLATEGGHTTLAAQTRLQTIILEVLNKKFSNISVEKVLSGPGLSNLYLALAEAEGVKATSLRSAEITAAATKNKDSLASRTLDLFCSWLGQVCGDFALGLGARGGVYLGGGVLLKFTQFLVGSHFMDGFLAKTAMRQYLQQIPVNLITEGNSALLGAAAWYKSETLDRG